MKQFLKYTKVFFILQLIFVAFGIFSTLIPNSSVRKNIEQSIDKYNHEGIYPRPFINENGHQSDLFTDYLIIDLIYNSSPHKPFKYFLFPQGHFTDVQDHGVRHVKYSISNRGEESNFVYGRYWHGSSFFYKLLFVISTLSGVRWLIYMIVSIALFAFYRKLVNTISRQNTFLIMGGLIFVNYYLLFYSLQFTPVFLITFIGSIALINKNQTNKPLGILFMILGGLTSYFDLLTAPMITLGVPLLIWACMLPQAVEATRSIIKAVVFSLLWSAGYVLSWLFKWVLIWVFTDYSISDEIQFKLSQLSGIEKLSRFETIQLNFEIINFIPFVVSILILFVLAIIYFNKNGMNKAIIMIALALIPIIWIFFTSNHAERHNWFTYRNLWVAISGLFLAFSAIIRWEDIRLPRFKKQA